MAKSKSKIRFRGRFFLILLGLVGLTALVVVLVLKSGGQGEIQFGSINGETQVSAVVIRDESTVLTEPYQKITFNVVEGETVSSGDLIAQVYKRGYQDETMITLLNLQRQIYAYQLQMLGSAPPEEVLDLNERIATVEEQIREVSRGDSTLDMLTLEQTLRNLLTERGTLLSSIVAGDATLNAMYTEQNAQMKTQESWRKDIRNDVGTGIVSFYFDGYERVLSIDKLSTCNAALVNSVVRGGNTSSATDSNSETPLYRIINNMHWLIAFVTKADAPMRLVAGEQYEVVFPDYSEQTYTATARETTVSENAVVNILEFHTDIGKLVGVRTVSAVVRKAAQGMVVPLDAIIIEGGIPGINVNYGETALRVEVEVLAVDEKKAVIRTRNEADTLAAGQKFIKP